MPKVAKTFTLDEAVVEHLDQSGNASAYANRALRLQIVRDSEDRAHGSPISDVRRAAARAWARDVISKADALEDDPEFQADRRRLLGDAA